MKKWSAVMLILCMAVSLLAACGDTPVPAVDSTEPVAIAQKKEEGTRAKAAEVSDTKAAASYSEVLKVFSELNERKGTYLQMNTTGETTAADKEMVSDDGNKYSDTNVQVAGVDEADVVKTDGEYIYILGYTSLQIVRADGEKTETVSTLQLKLPEADPESEEESYTSVDAMYISENTVSVIWTQEQWNYGDGYYYSNTTHLSTYDTTNKQAPKFVCDVAQDGCYKDSRMTEGIIYLVSVKYLFDTNLTEDSVIPCVYAGDTAKKLAADSIYLCPETDTTGFTLVSAIDGKSGAITDICSFTDDTDTIYMDGAQLYMARSFINTGESEPYKENQYTVVDYLQKTQTEIRRIGLADGKLTLEKSGSVEGGLLNQFALDVYQGNLRVATTEKESSYSLYSDEAYGWSNYVSLDDKTENRVTVLDGDLKELSSIGGLAPDESIYAVRFIGEIAYVVTYESVDPIFTIDLKDPANPKLCSELEVAGVSMYLHPFGDGLLFGFGQSTEDASFTGLQLSMFDVSDSQKVKLVAQKSLESDYSEALYNHKAILVNAQENIIAFPSDAQQYETYSYENGAFKAKGTIAIGYYTGDMRSLFIGDYLYICGKDVLYVAKLDTCEVVATLNSAEG